LLEVVEEDLTVEHQVTILVVVEVQEGLELEPLLFQIQQHIQ